MRATRALVRRPGPRLAEGIVTHIDRRPVDVELAIKQWHGYVAAMQSAGWDPVEVPAADDCPDAVFVEDTVVIYRDLAVITRPGADARRAEIAGTEGALASLGYRIERIESPGTLDGGDVLKVADVMYVGCGGRTNGDGVRQLRRLVAPLDARVVGVPVSKVLHLKSAVTALPDGTVVGYPPLVDDVAMFPQFLAVPEESGAHVVLLGQDRLLVAVDCPRSIELFRRIGYEAVEVDVSEFQKLEGCVTCLSVRLRG
ncbi:MAG TPA: N(G),N(G)-dimethylarginine dimethylaminohydrolase [Mycobacteriales bacterium]|jgi:dimethylargininase|nr:N(G),N(G)-dimethylarginine dimethylaminohydrolase [Mycobacteriales bacterium]